ncbi:hypothetical protein [Streptomyces gilvus]|uniref:hypothetical protein n=1 Tax=Streptomyces gilvus TaxID=2920937 RepID=UPI001F106AF1|nr:hypothetical protein [Streptomyces sp. CME 23]MCH5677933.1 hypothetical protein [Streptomyces sp. CME 23]
MSDETIVKQLLDAFADEVANGISDDAAKATVAQLLSTQQVTDVVAPSVLRRQVIQLHLLAANLLDEADRMEYKAELRKAAKAVDGLGDEARLSEAHLVEAVEAAIQAERQAEDEARDAAENHRLAAEAERDGQHQGLSASEQTDRLVRARAAADVASRFQAAAEGAKAHHESLERQLVAARDLVRSREVAEAAAYSLVKNPPKAPTSAYTALLDGVRRLLWGQEMDKQGMAVTAGLVQDAAQKTGLTRHVQATAIEEHDKELLARSFDRRMPAPGHPLRPANPTSAVFAVRPPT